MWFEYHSLQFSLFSETFLMTIVSFANGFSCEIVRKWWNGFLGWCLVMIQVSLFSFGLESSKREGTDPLFLERVIYDDFIEILPGSYFLVKAVRRPAPSSWGIGEVRRFTRWFTQRRVNPTSHSKIAINSR